MDGYIWAEKKPGEWWYAQLIDGEPVLTTEPINGCCYPPAYMIGFYQRPNPPARVKDISCLHLYRYFNGAGPGDRDDDEDNVSYMHICDLADFIAELSALREALPPEVEA